MYFRGQLEAAKLRHAGRGARSAPFGGGNELKKTGARSALARTRGQNPLVVDRVLKRLLSLSFSLTFRNGVF
jgi:hypothetical protein